MRSYNPSPETYTPNRKVLRSAVGSARAIFSGLRRVGKRIGEAQARAVMSAFYYVVLGPVAFVGLRRRNPSSTDSTVTPGWHPALYRRAADHCRQQY
jgi:hypothetical protein